MDRKHISSITPPTPYPRIFPASLQVSLSSRRSQSLQTCFPFKPKNCFARFPLLQARTCFCPIFPPAPPPPPPPPTSSTPQTAWVLLLQHAELTRWSRRNGRSCWCDLFLGMSAWEVIWHAPASSSPLQGPVFWDDLFLWGFWGAAFLCTCFAAGENETGYFRYGSPLSGLHGASFCTML